MTMHFPDEVDTNQLTIEANDPKSRHGRVQGRRRSGSRSSPVPHEPVPSACWWRATEWTCTSSTRGRRATSARPSTHCSGRRQSAGRAAPDAGADGRHAVGGHAARAQRHLLLPALHAVKDRVGWISPGALDYSAGG